MTTPRTIGLATTGRADYFLIRPIALACLEAGLDVHLYVCGGHLSPGRGDTIGAAVETFGPRVRIIATNLEGDRPQAATKSVGVALISFAQALEYERPDLMLVLGDRFETIAVGLASVQMGLPLVHVHGGEVSEGALDDSFRHALTKLAHLHMPAAEPFADRIRAMGEEPFRVHVTGAPGLDAVRSHRPAPREALEARLGASVAQPLALVTLHPETVGDFDGAAAVASVAEGLRSRGLSAIVTASNQDPGHEAVMRGVADWAAGSPDVIYVPSLGDAYLDALHHVDVVVGNSSSGLIEAASIPRPVLNLGHRQDGRLKPPNVIDAPFEAQAIGAALDRALSPEFAAGFADLPNPYGDGGACRRIAEILRDLVIDDKLMRKRFASPGERQT